MAVDVVLTGGGTGGHIYPGIAIADALKAQQKRVAFIGTADRLEAQLVPAAGYELRTVSSRPLTRKPSLELVRTGFANAAGVLQGLAALRALRPHLVIATGGYVCFPAVTAARLLGIAAVLLEPNAHPGLTNRLLTPLVREVWGAFPDGDPRFGDKYVFTGIPVRDALRTLPARAAAARNLGLDPQKKTLLVMGGSQGARSINDAFVAILAANALPADWQSIHITGEREYDRVAAASGNTSAVRPYISDLTDAYGAADLVVCRAGASTLGELAAIGTPAILVPYPYAADDHQRANARRFAQSGAALVVEDSDLAGGALRAALDEATSVARLTAMQAAAEALKGNDATETILARIDALLARKGPA